MALNAYLRLKGAQQGDIRGSVIQKGREGRIAVIAIAHEIVSPRDSASGLPTGRRMHKPLVITKELDKASPLLHRALVTNESIASFTLDLFAARSGGPGAGGAAGAEVLEYTIALADAAIASIRTVMPNNRDPELAKRATYEEIAFTYRRITWTWTDGAITATDDWESPVV